MYTRQQHTTGKNPSTHPQPCTAAIQQQYSTTAVHQYVVQRSNPGRDPPTHHDIVKQYRKGLTAVFKKIVDVYIYPRILVYPWYHSVPKNFICRCSGRDSCMLTSRCMLPSLRSAPYPALCPCEPLRPVGDMQAVSYGARYIPYNPLLPDSRVQPRSIVERPHSGPMCRVDIYTTIPA